MPPAAAVPDGPVETRWEARRRRLAELAASFVGLTAHGVTVLTATAEFEDRTDVGDTMIYVTLGLTDPSPGRRTWPLDAIVTLERAVRHRSYAAGFDEFVYVRSTNAHRPSADERHEVPRGRVPVRHERPEFR